VNTLVTLPSKLDRRDARSRASYTDAEKEGITILLVEQNVRQTLAIADRACVLENGHNVLEGPCCDLAESEHVRKAYLGY